MSCPPFTLTLHVAGCWAWGWGRGFRLPPAARPTVHPCLWWSQGPARVTPLRVHACPLPLPGIRAPSLFGRGRGSLATKEATEWRSPPVAPSGKRGRGRALPVCSPPDATEPGTPVPFSPRGHQKREARGPLGNSGLGFALGRRQLATVPHPWMDGVPPDSGSAAPAPCHFLCTSPETRSSVSLTSLQPHWKSSAFSSHLCTRPPEVRAGRGTGTVCPPVSLVGLFLFLSTEGASASWNVLNLFLLRRIMTRGRC